MDDRLLKPGWAGDLADDELAFIKSRLSVDKTLARIWGFRPGAKLRPDRAIRAVAQDGDRDNIALNRSLARGPKGKPSYLRDNNQSSDTKLKTCRSEMDNPVPLSSNGSARKALFASVMWHWVGAGRLLYPVALRSVPVPKRRRPHDVA